jgi:iron-sulfur cluster assembly accessory protein
MQTASATNDALASATGDASDLVVTERAARRILKVLSTEVPGAMLRISVSGGGCSGFQYVFSVDATRNDDDHLIERDGARVLVDETSLPFLKGSQLDFVDDLMGQAFKVENPNATASCGCGTSFAL